MATYIIIALFVLAGIASIQTITSERRKFESELRGRGFPDDQVQRQSNAFVLKAYAKNAALLVVFCYLTIFLIG